MNRNLPYELLAAGRFGPDRLCIEWRNEPRATTPEIEAMIAAEWERRTDEAKEKGQLLFDGRPARYIDHRLRDRRLHITVGPTTYRDFVGTNLYNHRRVEELGWHRFANALGTTGLIISTDEFIVLGRRTHRVAYHGGYLHTIGGGLEERDYAGRTNIDGFAAVLRELREECGITDAEVTAIECIGLARDTEILQPELLFEVRVSLSANELRCRLDHADPHQEHVDLECCPDCPDAVVPFLQNAEPVAPVAVAAVMLHGKLTWGDEWYAATTDTWWCGRA